MRTPRRPRRTNRRALRTVLLASGISNLGDGVRRVALPLLATRLTTDPVLISLVAAAAQLPWLAAPLLGLLVDRVRPLRLMALVDLVRGGIIGGLAVILASDGGHIALLAGAAMVLGLADVLADSAAQVMVPVLVADSELETGNARLMGVQATAALFIGPPLGAWLVALSLPAPFAFDAVTFLCSCALLVTIRRFDRTPPPAQGRRGLSAELSVGFRWALADPVMRKLVAVVVGLSFVDGIVGGILVLFATRELDLGGYGYGALLSVAALGSVVGTAAAGRLVRTVPVRSLLVLATVGAGLSYMVLGLVGSPVLAGAMLALNSAMTMLWNVLTVSARQRLIPEDILARVTTIYRMAAWGSMPLGSVAGGFLAREIGLRPVVLLSGVALTALTALVARLPAAAVASPVKAEPAEVS